MVLGWSNYLRFMFLAFNTVVESMLRKFLSIGFFQVKVKFLGQAILLNGLSSILDETRKDVLICKKVLILNLCRIKCLYSGYL